MAPKPIMSTTSAAGDVEARNISIGDFVVILCTNPRDACALALPNIPDAYVFIVKVTEISVTDIVVGGDQDIDITGNFFFNKTKDITKPLNMRARPIRMLLETWDIVDVFDGTDPIDITPANIRAIEISVHDIHVHDAKE